MIYLYVKTHNVTGLKYLGQTKNKNPHGYSGSGLYWKLHLKRHGRDFSTEIIKECTTQEEVRQWGVLYSNLWNVVESDEWANLKPETGDGGCLLGTNLGRQHSAFTKQKISDSKKGKPINRVTPISEETKKKLSESLKGRERKPEAVAKQLATKIKNGTLTHTEETKQKMRKPKSESHKANIRANHTRPTKDSTWINNGIATKQWKGEIPEGWFIGRLIDMVPPSQKGKRWITNGEVNKMSFDVPKGWWVGRTRKSQRELKT
jgi:hypothetical protein